MVFIGGWQSRRRRRYPDDGSGPYGPGPYGPGPYDEWNQRGRFGRRSRRGYGGYGGGGGSCMRDLFLVEGGCCLAEAIGCGPQLVLIAPSVLRHGTARRYRDADTESGSAIVRAMVALITMYQREISARRGPTCRFTPTCSHYALEALQVHGAGRGGRLALARLWRCRPSAAPGADPVPPERAAAGTG